MSGMITTLSRGELVDYTSRQLDTFFPDGATTGNEIARAITDTLDRCEHCFEGQRRRWFLKDGRAQFDHLYTDQYAVYLYYLSNTIFRTNGDLRVATKIYALNKALHSWDAFYEIDLPDIFAVQHPVGTVLGRAQYGNYLFLYQGCCVGVGVDGNAPVLGEGTILFDGSSVIGGCVLGNNVWISAGTLLHDTTVPPNSIVYGRYPNIEIKPTRRSVILDAFNIELPGVAEPSM
jgi:serine O-acetyltransferase